MQCSPSGGDTPDHHEIARQFSGQILAAYKKQLYEDQEQLQPFTVYSEKITDFEDISRTYDRMLQIHALNFFVNEPWVISVDDPRFHQNPVPYNDLLLILDLLKHAVMDRDERQAGLCIRQLFDKIRLS